MLQYVNTQQKNSKPRKEGKSCVEMRVTLSVSEMLLQTAPTPPPCALSLSRVLSAQGSSECQQQQLEL
jgi:hypothetical protein